LIAELRWVLRRDLRGIWQSVKLAPIELVDRFVASAVSRHVRNVPWEILTPLLWQDFFLNIDCVFD
jgi:hypothetical protein